MKTYKIRNTGNSVANYTEEIKTCKKCKGKGKIDISDKIDNEGFDEIECPECNGKGYFVRRY